MPEALTGRCLCGRVVFEVTPPTKWCANCHCTICRRSHGAAFVTWVGVPSAQFRIVAGERELRGYASTPEALRRFCGHCGSSLLFESSKWPGEVHVVRANFDGEIDRPVAGDAFTDEPAAWLPPPGAHTP
jgi:hypothetical protein